MVFLSGGGGGRLGFSVQNTPAIGLGAAGGNTAGLAQLWIVVFKVGGVGGSLRSTVPCIVLG